MDKPPERPHLLREMLGYDPQVYAALHSVPPADDGPPRRHRSRGLVFLVVIAALPAALFALVSAGLRHIDVMSSASLVVFLVAWLLILLVGVGRSVLLRER